MVSRFTLVVIFSGFKGIHLNCHVDMRVNKKTGKKANPIISRNVTEMSKIASHMI